MKLSKLTILALKGTEVEVRERLANVLGVSLPTLYRYISDNDDTLTKAASLEVIREITGLGDNEILEREPITADALK